jgi:hypothetical protein
MKEVSHVGVDAENVSVVKKQKKKEAKTSMDVKKKEKTTLHSCGCPSRSNRHRIIATTLLKKKFPLFYFSSL